MSDGAPTARPVSAPTTGPLTPMQAAQRVQVSRRTIMRAVESRELPAVRDNRNRWKIESEDLDNWAEAHCVPTGQKEQSAHSPDADAHQVESVETALAVARATIAQLEARLEDQARAQAALAQALEDRTRAAETDRDRWRALAERMAPPVAHAIPTRRWWPWRR